MFNTKTTLNIFLCDLFLVIDSIDFTSYAKDNTSYTIDKSAEKVTDKLEIVAKSLFRWFSDNQIKVNPNKCHFLQVLQVKTITNRKYNY